MQYFFDDMVFHLFVYGTLKRGLSNFERHCAGALSIEPAQCWGRLYDLDAGYPAMEVSELSIQARGTQAYALDAQNKGKYLSFDVPAGDWDVVQGELMRFDPAEQFIPAIDHLEDFDPERQDNLYERVLVTVRTDKGLVNAWTYIMKDGKHAGVRLSLNSEGVVEWFQEGSGFIAEGQTATSLYAANHDSD